MDVSLYVFTVSVCSCKCYVECLFYIIERRNDRIRILETYFSPGECKFKYINYFVLSNQNRASEQLFFFTRQRFCKASFSVQGVTMRCRLSLLTNSDLVYEPKCGGRGGGGGCGVSSYKYSCTQEPK